MTSKRSDKEMTASSLPALKIGSRVRCSEDGMEGRITWANGVSVKVQWDDGEQITWRRDSLADRPIEILDPIAADEATDVKETSADGEPNVGNNSPVEEAIPLPPVAETSTDTTEPAPAEPMPLLGDDAEVQMPAVISDAVAEATVPSRRRRKAPVASKEKKISAVEASIQVLAEAGQAMTCQEMIAAMAEKGYWTSPGGKTPHATLYSAILREITTKGADSRFVKADRGKFALANPA
jgi:hypothetical protein